MREDLVKVAKKSERVGGLTESSEEERVGGLRERVGGLREISVEERACRRT